MFNFWRSFSDTLRIDEEVPENIEYCKVGVYHFARVDLSRGD